MDTAAAHKWFSSDYFNRVWQILDKGNPTAEEGELMISMSHASLAHWRERPDCGPREISVGWWQLSRVYGVLRQAENARHYGALSLAAAQDESAFFLGYAHEALARAAKVAGDEAVLQEHLSRAMEFAAQVEDELERQWLEADLASLREQSSLSATK
jgi:hypothetical protein